MVFKGQETFSAKNNKYRVFYDKETCNWFFRKIKNIVWKKRKCVKSFMNAFSYKYNPPSLSILNFPFPKYLKLDFKYCGDGWPKTFLTTRTKQQQNQTSSLISYHILVSQGILKCKIKYKTILMNKSNI